MGQEGRRGGGKEGEEGERREEVEEVDSTHLLLKQDGMATGGTIITGSPLQHSVLIIFTVTS